MPAITSGLTAVRRRSSRSSCIKMARCTRLIPTFRIGRRRLHSNLPTKLLRSDAREFLLGARVFLSCRADRQHRDVQMMADAVDGFAAEKIAELPMTVAPCHQ